MKKTRFVPLAAFSKQIKRTHKKDNTNAENRKDIINSVSKENSRNNNVIQDCKKRTKEFIEHYPLPSRLNGYNPDVIIPAYAVETEPFEPHLVDTDDANLLDEFNFNDFGEIHIPAFDKFDENGQLLLGQNVFNLGQISTRDANPHFMEKFPPFPNFTYPKKEVLPNDIDSRQKRPFPKP